MKAGILVAVGVLTLLVVPWILRRLSWRYGRDTLVIPPLSKARYRFLNSDEALAERTAKKRSVADGSRKRAAQVDSGTPVSDLLRRVK